MSAWGTRLAQKIIELLLDPVGRETRELMRRKWLSLPQQLRTPQQLYGRYDEGCGATVGVMPRCDFACRGCYLGNSANKVPPLPLEDVKSQMRALRRYLGRWGNLQLTDGEVTLRPENELIELVRYACELELVPMLMTHGDTLRRRPALLRRLVTDGGLREICVHIDTTQRGRFGARYRRAASEEELNPLREEFAELIRMVRADTGRPLRAAATVTVHRGNLAEVASIVRCYVRNSDVFQFVSLLPAAQVGRTSADLQGVDLRSLWCHIGAGLPGQPVVEDLIESQWWLGHPACSRILTGFVWASGEGGVDFRALSPRDAADRRFLARWLEKFGGLTFRGDTHGRAAARAIGMLLRSPRFMTVELVRYCLRWLRSLGAGRPLKLAWRLATHRAELRRFTVVSHHFMGRAETETQLGAERLEHCVFRVAAHGKLVSMCEFNARGGRERYYGIIASEHSARRARVAGGGTAVKLE